MIGKFLVSATLFVSIAFPLAAQTPAVIEKDVMVSGFRLHYREAGRGEPVVLPHGLGGDGSRWGPNIEPLAADFHVIALDEMGSASRKNHWPTITTACCQSFSLAS